MRSLLALLLVLGQDHGLPQDVIGGDGDKDCCPLLTVNVGGVNADLDGQYKLKAMQNFKPEEPCLNGCIYTKEGALATEEYCFKLDNEAGADVQCEVCHFVCNIELLFSYFKAQNLPYGSLTQPTTTKLLSTTLDTGNPSK